MRINDGDLKAVAGLWRELAAFPLSQAREARTHCLEGIVRIIGADNAFWVPATYDKAARSDDLLLGWRPKALVRLHPNPGYERRLADVMQAMERNAVDPTTLENIRRAGVTRAFLRRELVPEEVWERSWLLNDMLRPSGVEDRMVGAHALDPTRESYMALERGRSDRRFGARERDLLYLFLLGSSAYQREQFLAEGIGQPPLTRREREVLALLLTDLSEREIGAALGLTWRSTHQYCVSIFAKFAVRGRVGLMAHFLGKT